MIKLNVLNIFMQRRLDEAKEQGLKEGKGIGFDVGYEKGEKQGLITGNKQTEAVVNLFNQLVNNMEKELTELREYKNSIESTINNKTPQLSEKELIEQHMFYFSSYYEIINTRFFYEVLYQTSTSESIQDIINYIDFLEHSIDVKNAYPETSKLLPDLRKAYEKLYKNKLVVEEAEGLL